MTFHANFDSIYYDAYLLSTCATSLIIGIRYCQINVQFLLDLLVANLLVIVGTHLIIFTIVKIVWQTSLISGHFIVLHYDLMLVLCIFTYNELNDILSVVFF
jgi:hypothetical protein